MVEEAEVEEADELEAVIRKLVYRLDDAREDSAEHRIIARQLMSIREFSELGS